jgi:hypothetical protein
VNREERRRSNRNVKRELAAQGVAAVSRISIEHDAIVAAQEKGVDLVDLVMLHVDQALHALIDQGGDILGKTVVLIGEHPDEPGAVTIEAKVATLVKADNGGAAL